MLIQGICVSKTESEALNRRAAKRMPARAVQLESWSADIVELAALRARAQALERIAGARGIELPVFGRSIRSGDHLALCVRPNRWLILTTPPSGSLAASDAPVVASETAAAWSAGCAGVGVAIDLSSALSAFHLTGAAAHEVVARNCRVDLDADLQAARRLRALESPEEFQIGTAIATIMAQVSVVLTRLDSGILLLTPATTARHFSEWLAAALPGDPLP